MRIVTQEELPHSVIAREFVGERFGSSMTIVLVDAPPGTGPRLHRHPYEELIIVQEGEGTFRTGEEEKIVRAGEIVVIPAGQAHAFANTGTGPLRQIDIHASPSFSTEWLEARDG